MNNIDFDNFLAWANKTFGEDNVIRRGDEVCINSPFTSEPDYGKHLYCNPDKGVYHCFKTDKGGSLRRFIIERGGEEEVLGCDLQQLEEKIKKFMENKKSQIKKKEIIEIPKGVFKIVDLDAKDAFRELATKYLKGRKLPIDDLYIGKRGEYAYRILIPYYDKDGNLFYYNSRNLKEKGPRYLGPKKTIGIGKSDVVWMKTWPAKNSKVYLTEGEFDAMSLCACGLNGAACGGKEFSDKQLQLLKDYNLTISFDLDKYGYAALNKVVEFVRGNQFVRGSQGIGYTLPAKGFKDWNEMLIGLGENVLKSYVQETEKPLDWEEIVRMKLNS